MRGGKARKMQRGKNRKSRNRKSTKIEVSINDETRDETNRRD